VVLETAGLNATELSAYSRERGLYPEQVERWRQAATDANEKPVLTLKEQKELERLGAQDQREFKRLKKELPRKDIALAEAVALLLVTKKTSLSEAWLNRDSSPLAAQLKEAWSALRQKIDPSTVVFDIGSVAPGCGRSWPAQSLGGAGR